MKALPAAVQVQVQVQVQALSLQQADGPRAGFSLDLLAGVGIIGDRHAAPDSPRQLLLADSAAYRALQLAPQALRENLLLNLDTASLASGSVLQIGATVQLRIMFQCEACARLNGQQASLAQRIGARRGVLARVLVGGTITSGDPVHLLGVLAAPWSDDWRLRVAAVLAALPPGLVLDYRQLARLAGVQSSYCRAFPRLLSKLGPDAARRACATGAALTQARWDGAGLFERN